MASVPLPLVEKNSGLELEAEVPSLLARRLDLRGALAVSAAYRRMGIAKLLMSGVPERFHGDLSRSARAFLHFLEGAGEEHKVTSRAEPFFDAVAAGDDDAAARIARATRPTFAPGRELEEDFLHVWFLMSRFSLRSDAAVLDPLLARWEQVLEGSADPRLDLCRALATRDQPAFDAALEAIVSERRRSVAAALEAGRLLPEDGPTTAKVWVQLLALLRLADGAGLRTDAEVPLAPSVARRIAPDRLPGPDAWKRVPSYRELR